MTITATHPLDGFFDVREFFRPLLTLFSSIFMAKDEEADETDDDVEEGDITVDEDSDDYIPDEEEDRPDPDDEDDDEEQDSGSDKDRKEREAIERRRRKTDRGLFSDVKKDEDTEDEEDDEEDEPEPKPKKGDKDKPAKAKTVKPAKDADGNIDYEADDVPEEEDEEEDDVEDEEEEDDDPEAKGPVAEAKRSGKELKRVKRTLTEKELELSTARQELQEANERISELSKVKVNPKDVPEYSELFEAVWADIDGAIAEDLPASCKDLDKFMNGYMGAYINATRKSASERAEAITELKQTILTNQGGLTKEELEDGDPTDLERANLVVKEVMALIKRNAPKVIELRGLEEKIGKDSEAGRIAVNLKDYEKGQKELRALLSGVGKLDEKLIKEDPYSPEALLSQLVKNNPATKARLEQGIEDIVSFVQGMRPLSVKEYEELETNGTDIKAFLKSRKAAHVDKVKRLAPMLLRGLVTANFSTKALKALIEEQAEKLDDKDDLDTLADIERKNKRKIKGEKDTKERPKSDDPRRRPLAISKHL